MRLVFAGTPEAALTSLEALVASRHEVVAVVTRPDAPTGRGRRLAPSVVGARAAELGLEVLKPTKPSELDFTERLRGLAPDACPVVAYGALLPQSVLDIPRHGWLNLHFSVLPRWRGAAPVQRAVMAGDPEIGTTCFRIVRELDAGDVFLSESFPRPEATAGELLAQLAQSGSRQLLSALDLVEAGVVPTPQAAEGVTLAPKLTVDEARIDWSRPAADLLNHVLGCSPDPGAWCQAGGERLKVYRARLAPAPSEHDTPSGSVGVGAGHPGSESGRRVVPAPGEVATTKRSVTVGTGDGALELLEVQPAGRKRMSGIDWARNLPAGTVLA